MSEIRPISENESLTSQSKRLKGKLLASVLLILIVLLGAYFRFMSLNWDDFSALHPDERFLTLNLLPVIGGNIEFTADNDRFPSQTLVVKLDTAVISSLDIQSNEGRNIAAVHGTFSLDMARWWVGDDRVIAFDSVEQTIQALQTGEVEAIITDQSNASQQFLGTNIRVLDNFDSPTVQRIRCTGLYPETGGIGGYFDTFCSSMNPHNSGQGSFAYGTLPLFMAYWAKDIVVSLEQANIPFVTYEGNAVIWRFLSALFDVGTIILIFLTGRQMHNKWVGLLAAILYACAPLAIEKSHFGTVNALTNFWVTLAIWAAVHVQDRGRFSHYTIFGIAFGAALAGRINVIPLAGLVVLAGMVNAAPVLDSQIAWSERERLLWRNLMGVFIAGFVTIIAFRIFNPYAFTGPSFFHLIPNARFLADAQSSSYNVSGASDAPPNWQWLGRFAYLYPLKDMLFWGMGIAMGVMAWFGFLWSGYRLVRGRDFAIQNILIFAWVLVYFGWIGKLWVMTMRYFLPLYGALALFAAWALYELYRQGRERDIPLTRVVLIAFGAFFGLIPIFAMNTGNLTPTAMASGVISLGLWAVAILPKFKYRAIALSSFVVAFTMFWGLMYTNIYRHEATRVQASRWVFENVSGDFSMQIEGAAEGTPLINIAVGNRSGDGATKPEDLPGSATIYQPGMPAYIEFTAPASGTISSIHAPHLADPLDDPDAETLYISIAKADSVTPLLEINLTKNFSRKNHPLGDSYDMAFDTPIEVIEGERYIVKIEAINKAIVGSGVVMLTEGTWDDRITSVMICQLPDGITLADDPPSGLVSYNTCNGRTSSYTLLQSYDLVMSYPVDEQLKYDNIVDGLGVGDYLAITSNRFYDSETRNPARWPMTTAYYKALFEGKLAYELVQVFSESFQFGPFSVDDQYLPIYDSPAWFNELEADEAFHVYDHPAVFIFRKTENYDQARTQLLLSEPMLQINQIGFGSRQTDAQLVGLVYWSSLDADKAPTGLMMPDDIREMQEQGGTWSERFDSDSVLNTVQPLGVMVWWMSLVMIGLITWPILFTAFPKLGDGAYGFSKMLGMLLLGWIAWILANFRLPMWSQGGLFTILLLLAALSAYLVYSRRRAFAEFLLQNWKRLFAIEGISFLLFLSFIGIRLLNPDLWHHPMGGEKPMDFAYFNAVLRSTVFPAYDPWYSGGYLNYYYFGFVIAGVPTLLLKIVPSFAYNLLVPTFFALTGIAAFSAAFNIVDSWTSRRTSFMEKQKSGVITRVGNPWMAGLAALLLSVVLGNLDTPRVWVEEGIAPLGGYQRPTGLENYLTKQYITEQGEAPIGEELSRLQERASRAYLTDNIAYELSIRVDLWSSFWRGLPQALGGQPLPMGSNRWYWAPTRIIDETPGVGGNAITEIPFFTFLYGDLHAHMVDMPLMLFALAFVFYEVMAAKRDDRSIFAQFLAIFLGALAIGMMRAINSWDWPSFMLFAGVGLAYAWWRRWGTISRASLAYLLASIGGFVILALYVAAPFTDWFASAYGSFKLWDGNKTPLWAYWNIHGLFLFLAVSLMIWDTGRWLRETRVRSLQGQGVWLLAGTSVIGVLLVAALILTLIGYQVALIVIPLIIWIALLFFRPNQSVAMQFVLVLLGFALALTLGVEVIVLSGDIGRQNTVFKFYIQVWMLLSVAGGAAFAWLVQHGDLWRFRVQVFWFTPLMILIASAVMFPFAATRARMLDRFVPDLAPTLNGMDYMEHTSHYLLDYGVAISLENDYHLIHWMQENVQGTPVIMEGRSLASEYRYNLRFSINIGLPAVLGWRWHQVQQRTLDPLSRMVPQREANIQYFYNTGDIPTALEMVRAYDVRYIIVSDMELAMYSEEGIAKFQRMEQIGLLSVAYQYGLGMVFEVNREAVDTFMVQQLSFNDAIGLDETILPSYVPQTNGMHTPDLTVNVDAALDTLSTFQLPYVVVTNPPRVLQYQADVYDRLIVLEQMAVLEIIDDLAARRTYRINQDVLREIKGEES
jgi:YYY domain-containing protein